MLIDPAEHFGLKKGYYKISAVHGVWSVFRKRLLKPKARKNGYISLNFEKEGSEPRCRLFEHVVIKESFHGKTPFGMVIDHTNRNPGDNQLSNLRFATFSENSLNSNRSGLPHGQCRPINQYHQDGTLIRSWPSGLEAALTLGYSFGHINKCCLGKCEVAYGFNWDYNEPNLDGEIWKAFNELQASNYGHIRFPNNRVTYGTLLSTGYRRIQYQQITYGVHVIVCTAFYGVAPAEGMVPNHKNEDPNDNRPENLEWLTVADNLRYSHSKPVLQLTLEGELVAEFESIRQASAETFLHAQNIGQACSGVAKTTGGFCWQYKNPEDLNMEPNSNCIPVKQYELNGNYVRTFTSAVEACLITGINSDSIRNCCLNKRGTAGGYLWSNAEDPTPQPVEYAGKSRAVEQLTLNGEHVAYYKSLTEAERQTKHDRHRISECCKGERDDYHGYIWKLVSANERTNKDRN